MPIRLPDTICVQERLPPGAAGVLINQTHTYRDLYSADLLHPRSASSMQSMGTAASAISWISIAILARRVIPRCGARLLRAALVL